MGEDVYTHNKILELENEVIENLSNLYTGKDTETQCSENLNLITKIEFDEAIDNLEQLENKILDRCKGNIFGICKTFLKEEGYEDLVQEIENIIQIDANESNHFIEENNHFSNIFTCCYITAKYEKHQVLCAKGQIWACEDKFFSVKQIMIYFKFPSNLTLKVCP